MLKADVVEKVAKEAHLTKKAAKEAVDSTFNTINSALKKWDKVVLSGFVTFIIRSIKAKVGTGEHDLAVKAKRVSEFLKEGNRVKVELFLAGRAKYMDKNFLNERLDRILNLITENYKIAEPTKKGPKGLYMIIEKEKK